MSEQQTIAETYAQRINTRLVDIREAATDVVSWSIQLGDKRTLSRMDDIFFVLNELEGSK